VPVAGVAVALHFDGTTVRSRPITAHFRARSARRWLLTTLVAVGLASLSAVVPTAAADSASELEVKAAFILNFLKFVEWPTPPPAGDAPPLVVIVVGDDPLAPALKSAAASATVTGRQIQLRIVKPGAAIEGAHMVFIAASEHRQLASILRQLEGHPVLTVGATEGFADSGVVLNLVVRDRKVRVEANTAAASRARLRVSAHLLRLARIVG
jgi:hypothetical protein